MFKVSLLPASYRKYLADKKKKDIILSVAVVLLLAMLIVYGGFAVRLLMLNGQLKDIKHANSVATEEIAELQQYKDIYDGLVVAQERVNSVMPRKPGAVKFLSLVQSNRPQYVNITSIAVQDWAGEAICIIDGELPVAQDIGAAVAQLNDYAQSFKTNPEYGGEVKEVKVLNDMPTITRENDGTETYAFRIFVSLSGVINLDQSGVLITTTTTTTTTTTAPSTESTEKTEETKKEDSKESDKEDDTEESKEEK